MALRYAVYTAGYVIDTPLIFAYVYYYCHADYLIYCVITHATLLRDDVDG